MTAGAEEVSVNRTTDSPEPAATAAAGEVTTPEEEGPLRRWSRRKAQARQDLQSSAPADPEAGTAPEPSGTDAASETLLLTDADMPPIESLDKDSDFAPFMSPGVSEALRTRALRRLFHSGLFNERCPLDSESYDFRDEEPLGSVITHEMREEMERAAAALKDKARQAAFEPDEIAAQPDRSGLEPATDNGVARTAPHPGADEEG